MRGRRRLISTGGNAFRGKGDTGIMRVMRKVGEGYGGIHPKRFAWLAEVYIWGDRHHSDSANEELMDIGNHRF